MLLFWQFCLYQDFTVFLDQVIKKYIVSLKETF